jgi:ribosomal protein L37AE/L43A
MSQELKPCPFCGDSGPVIAQPGTARYSCIVECSNCGCRHESGDEGNRSGTSWNERATPQGAPASPAEHQPWVPYLSDRADGVKGHYAIARWTPKGYREVWNLRSHQWASCSDDVLTLEDANALLIELTLSASPAPQAETGLREALEALLNHCGRNTCMHESTHRGGAIWTICDRCGKRWADDKGGFIPYTDAPAVAAARAALEAHPQEGI